ncbi:MAG: hypothetical protein PHY64_00400 [Eubacteriales bacterium]|nr:hypothetical protein [Eubacteriales bacterium]
MIGYWQMKRARADHRRMCRMMRGLPIYRSRMSSAPPPPIKLSAGWLTQKRLHWLDRALMILLLALVALLLTVTIYDAVAETQATPMYVTVSAGSWLNGRAKPDAKSSIEARFQRGDTVDVYEVEGSWARVAGGEDGTVWCCIDYLSDTAPGTEPETCTVTANGRVRVRKTPDGELVRWLQSGDSVQVQCRVDGWAYIGDGYVAEEYLEAAQ